MRDEQKGILFLLVIILIAAFSVVTVGLSLRTDTVGKTLESDSVIRMLFVIEDEEKNALLTETIVYYPVSSRATVVTIPENLGAIFASLGRVDAITTVYKEKGINAYRTEIENLLDVTIPFYFIISEKKFSRLVDVISGLRIFISHPIDVRDENGNRYLLPAGAVVLDGEKVSTYMNVPNVDDANDEKYERYQNTIVSLFTQLNEKKSLVQKKQTMKLFRSFIKSNLDKDDFTHLVSLLCNMNTEYILKQTVTGQTRIVDGKRLLFPLNNGDFIKQALAQSTQMLLSSGSTQVSRSYVLEIKNGTTIQGLAHNTAILYKNASYDILTTSNADRNDYEKTYIIDHIGNSEIAKIVGDFIHCTNIHEEYVSDADLPENAGRVDFTIVLGKDFDGRYVR